MSRVIVSFIDITERKHAEEMLRESHEDFQRYFNISTIGMAVTTPGKNWIEVNDRLCQIFGYSKQELAQLTWAEITHPDDLEANVQLFDQLISGEIDSYEMEKRYIRKDKSVVYTNIYATCYRNPDGKVRHLLTSVLDITERKLAEAALHENEIIFSSFLENSPVYVFFKDKNIRTLRLSKNYEQMLGMPVDKAIGKTMDDLFPSDLAKNMVADDLRILSEGRRVDIIEELNGRIYETTKFPIFIDGKADMLAGFTLDITDRKHAEIALRESEEKFRQLITSAPDAIFGIDKEGRIVFANEQSTEILGYSGEELIGKKVDLLVPLDWRSRHDASWTNFIAHSSTSHMGNQAEPIAIHKDGREIPVDIKLSYSNTISGMLVIAYMRDMTERKNTETQLRIANSQLETQMKQIQGLQLILREQAIRDPLTNLYNRRYLNETLQREFERIKREKSCLSIIIMDIDHFKNVNDALGHQVGDKFLVAITKILGKKARNSDIICRYGGEEFLLVMPDTTTSTASHRAEEIRLLCNETRLKYKEKTFGVTLSFGIATYPSHGKDPDEVITKADEALYRSKKNGRNCVTIWN
jgi:diguanylate cyclase (GGDEF)-like protein/PAS domain S-box-containing protein